MATEHSLPSWFLSPGQNDFYAWLSLSIMALAIYGIFVLYAKFDHWVEHRSKGTPLAKTIPTMLTIALLYEVFPLGHFNILLPISAILISLMADFTHFRFSSITGEPDIIEQDDISEKAEEPIDQTNEETVIETVEEENDILDVLDDEDSLKETKNV